MIYGIKDKLPIGKNILFSLQLMLSVFTATVLICQICGVDVSAGLIGAGLSTLAYLLVTQFNSPMVISNSGAYVAPVVAALAVGGYTGVMIGGIISCLIYTIFGIVFTKIPVDKIYKVFPKVLIGSVTVVIGINLMSFIPSYIGDTGVVGVGIALVTVLAIALSSHYFKGVWSLFPFLIGTLIGYVVSIPFGLVDFSKFNDVKLIEVPTFAFTQFQPIEWTAVASIAILFIAFTISAMMECLSDHAALGNIIGVDLYEQPGLGKIFIGEGVANLFTSFFGGLGACSYGEGIATVGFSKCGSIYATIGAAILMILIGFVGPVKAFIQSIPGCVIGGGTAMVLYGFIANSGIKVLQNIDFSSQKNLIICSVVLSLGISGVALGGATIALSGTALALVVGVVLNLILREKTE